MADLRTSDILAADWARRAREILDRNSTPEAREFRKTSIGPRGPRILEDHDLRSPDQVAADVILGRGTGRPVEDILTGLTPLPGAITEARGGESGILDWVPGTGLVKAGVIAMPKAANILKRIARTKSDEIVDMMKMVAEDVVEQFRHADHVPTRDEINAAVRNVTEGMDNNRGIDAVRRISGDMVENTMNSAARAVESGRVPSFSVKVPETVDVNFQALDIDPIGWQQRRTIGSYEKERRRASVYNSLPENEKRAIREQALADSHNAMDEAALAGITDPEELKTIRRRTYTNTADNLKAKAYMATRRDENWGKLADNVQMSNSETVNSIQRDAYNEALRMAREEGLSEYDAYRVAAAAGQRAKHQAMKAEGGAAREAELAQKRNEKKNLRVVYSMFSPEIQEEIAREADAARAAARQKYIDSGIDAKKATVKSADAGNSAREKLTRKLVKEMGFKSVNDPRLQQYSVLNRNGSHVLADGTASPVVQTRPSSILGGALDITDNDRAMQAAYDAGISERPLMAADVEVPYESPAAQILSAKPAPKPARLLPENEYSDADIAELLIGYGEQPTADAAFNREYAEMLMKEQGY